MPPSHPRRPRALTRLLTRLRTALLVALLAALTTSTVATARPTPAPSSPPAPSAPAAPSGIEGKPPSGGVEPSSIDAAAVEQADCGPARTKPDGSRWTCTFADDFTGSSLDPSKWVATRTADYGFGSGQECVVDDPDNVAVRNGTLRLSVRREAREFTCSSPQGDFRTRYTGGSVSTWRRFAQTHGLFAVRAKFPSAATPGLHSALWMYHLENTYGAGRASGEIDIAEYFTRYPDLPIPFVHYADESSDPQRTAYDCRVPNADQWHTYEVEWRTTTLTFRYDGRTCLVNRWSPTDTPLSDTAPFDRPFYLLLTQVLGHGTNAFSSETRLPGTMQVDWVRAWR